MSMTTAMSMATAMPMAAAVPVTPTMSATPMVSAMMSVAAMTAMPAIGVSAPMAARMRSETMTAPAAAMRDRPAAPAVAAAPADAVAPSVTAPVPAGSMPAVPIPAINPAVPDEGGLFDRGAGGDRRRGWAWERRSACRLRRSESGGQSEEGDGRLEKWVHGEISCRGETCLRSKPEAFAISAQSHG